MDQKTIIIQLKVLNEMLDRKTRLLKEVETLTENQTKLIKIQDSNTAQENVEIVKTKQQRIDELNLLDKNFLSIYNRLKQSINLKQPEQSKLLSEIQEKIKTITDITVRVKVAEQRNASYNNFQINKKPYSRMLKTEALKAYKNNNR